MRCKDIAKRFDVTNMTVGRARSKLFPGDNKCPDLTKEEGDALCLFFNDIESAKTRSEMEQAVMPKFIEAWITMARNTDRRVMCKAKNLDGTLSESFIAIMPFGFKGEDHIRGMVKLEWIETDSGTKYYRHASLSGRAWNVKS